MTIRFQISLPEKVAYGLRTWAESEKRTPRDQAAWIIEKELIRQGRIESISTTQSLPVECDNHGNQ